MNKLFTKIVGAFLGLTMAVGVGVVAANSNKNASPANAASTTGTYNKVTTADGISANDTIIIVDSAGNQALKSISTTSTKYGTLTGVSASNNTITLSGADVEEFTVETGFNSSGFSFKGTSNISGNYLYYGSGNSLNKTTTKAANSSWTITASNGTLTITNNNSTDRIIRFNSDRFACYSSNTGTLAQIYKKTATASYTVTYNANGGSGDAMADGIGSTVTIASCSYSYEGKTFIEWNTESNGKGTSYKPGAEVAATLNLYAIWGDTVTLSFNANGGTGLKDSINYGSGATVTVPANTFSKSGYAFDHWDTKADDSGTDYDPEDTFVISSNITLYAQWVEKYTSTFDLSKASYSAASASSVTWVESEYVTIATTQNSGKTAANNYLGGGGNDHTRFYSGNNFIVTPASGKTIYKVELTCTTDSYASAFASSSSLTNCSISSDGSVATMIPTNGANVFRTSSIGGQVRVTSIVVTYMREMSITTADNSTVRLGGSITIESPVDGVTWSSTDTAKATIDSSTGVVTPVAVGSTTIRASKDGYTTASITLNVAYADVTSVSITTSIAKLSLDSSFTFGATVLPSTAKQTVVWSVADKVGTLVEDTEAEIDPSTGELTVYTLSTGTLTVTATTEGKNSGGDSETASVDVVISGDPIVNVSAASIDGYTGKTASVSVTSIENFDTDDLDDEGLTYSWSEKADSSNIISSISGSDTKSATLNFHSSNTGDAVVTVTVTDSSSHTKSVDIEVSVVASAVVSVDWLAEDYDVFSGSTLTVANANDWLVTPTWNWGEGEEIEYEDFTSVNLGASTITLPHTWTAADDGKKLSVTYGGQTTSTVDVKVTQTINSVMAENTSDWSHTINSQVWSANGAQTINGKSWSATNSGSYFGYEGGSPYRGQQFGSGSAKSETVTISSSAFSGTILEVKVNAAMANNSDATLSVKVNTTDFECNSSTSVSLTTSPVEYTFVGSASGTIEITLSQTTTKAMYIKALSVSSSTGLIEIANSTSHKDAQRVAVKFANTFNTAMETTEGCTTNISSAWSACSTAYNTFKTEAAALGSTEEAYAKNLIKYATAQYRDPEHDPDNGNDCIERMMKTYEIMVNRGQSAFMSELVTLESAQTTSFRNNSSNATLILIAVSMISATALGGYFFLRKRKEQ